MTRPIFIVGSMRSGSTLFRLVLDSHPNIAISEETGFMGALAATKAIPNWRYGREWYGRLGWSEDELDARLREFYSGMFERYAASQGKPRWGEKTPLHSWHMAEMARVFPEAVFVAIVRHPGAVASSLVKKFHYDVHEAAQYWESTNTEVLRHGGILGDERFALVRYEDLAGRPEPMLRELLTWLEEPWSDGVLRHNDVQAAKGAPRLVDGNTSTRDPISPERADRWASTMSAADRGTILAETGRLAEFLGYDADGVAAGSTIGTPGGAAEHVLTGAELAKRQLDQRDVLSFDERERGIVAAEMSREELVQRVAQAEKSLARIRSRPVVKLADAVRRTQRRVQRTELRDIVAAVLPQRRAR